MKGILKCRKLTPTLIILWLQLFLNPRAQKFCQTQKTAGGIVNCCLVSSLDNSFFVEKAYYEKLIKKTESKISWGKQRTEESDKIRIRT